MTGYGVFVAVVGPSGAGKDTILRYASRKLHGQGGFAFVRRTITRPCDPASEDHDTLEPAAFEAADMNGAFAVSWASHGLRYGIPASIDGLLSNGTVVVANISRGVISALKGKYPKVLVIEITADPEILAARLAGRGRETVDSIASRLARNPLQDAGKEGWISIGNNGDVEEAGDRLVEALADCARY